MKTDRQVRKLGIPASKLWDAWFFDEEFQAGICKVFKIQMFDVELEKHGDWPDLRVHRELMFDNDRNIPKPLLKIVRGATKVRETSDLDGAARKLKVDLRVPVIGKRVDFGYTYTWSEADGETEVIWEGHCDVRIPLIRNLAESYMMEELSQATRDGAKFVRQWFGLPEPEDGDGGEPA